MDYRELMLLSLVILLFMSDFSISSAQIYGGREIPNFIDMLKLKTGSRYIQRNVDPSRVEQISWRPRAFIYRGFLTNEECDHFIALAKGKLEKSMVIDIKTGLPDEKDSEQRTSSGMFLDRKQDKIITGIEERIAAWTFFPLENGEAVQVLRYEKGQKYDHHTDFFEDPYNIEDGGNRVATVLMYLSDVAEGGETAFPFAEKPNNQQKGDNLSECAKKAGFAVKPRKGDALLFFGLHLNATPDHLSEHQSCPVIKGEKWSATKWIRMRYHTDMKEYDDECTDEDDRCANWASSGECKKNPGYMVGNDTHPGYCKKSCDAC